MSDQKQTEEKTAEVRARGELENGYYYLLDLERSITSGGQMYYWRPNRRGYTGILSEAGIYPEAEALAIALEDVDKRTVLIKFTAIKNIVLAKNL